ncbi:MAG: glycosyltransferase family 2 protein [Paludibacteraceae bacterium]
MQISVVIPVYNVALYLRQCVDRVLEQTYQDLQVILVDDGSTDQSGAMCDEYAQRDCRVQVIHKQNGGLSDARNMGTQCATGEYLLYLDSDDMWSSSDFVAQLVYVVQTTHVDMVLCCMNRFSDEACLPNKAEFPFLSEDFETMNAVETFSCLCARQQFPTSACCKMIRTSILQQNNIQFTKGLLGEDMDWNARVLPHIRSVAYSNDAVYLYRVRLNSITTTFARKNAEDFCWILEHWYKHFESQEASRWRTFFLAYYADLYVTLVYQYLRIPREDRSSIRERLIVLASILDYSVSPKSGRLLVLRRVLGKSGMVAAASLVGSVRKVGLLTTLRAL